MRKHELAETVEGTLQDAVDAFLLHTDTIVNSMKVLAKTMNVDAPFNSYLFSKDRLLLAIKDCVDTLDRELEDLTQSYQSDIEDLEKDKNNLLHEIYVCNQDLSKLDKTGAVLRKLKEAFRQLTDI